MKVAKLTPTREVAPNVVPLIDIVMCLIVFYMLVAKFGVETGADRAGITLPLSLQGIQLTDRGNTIDINVRQPAMGDEPLVSGLDEQGRPVNIPVAATGGRTLVDLLRFHRGTNKDFKVNIRADENLHYRFLEPVLIACAEARVAAVNFATRQP